MSDKTASDDELLATFAEVRVVLETDPWSGRPWRRGNTDAALRAHSFAEPEWSCT